MRLILSLIIVVIPFLLMSETDEPLKPELAASPQLSYSGETGFIFGAIILYQFYSNSIIDPFFRNKLQLQTVYTERKQFGFTFEPEFYQDEGRTRIAGKIEIFNWPSEFYGIGNNSFSESETYTRKGISVKLELDREIYPRIYLGPIIDFDSIKIGEKEGNCLLQIAQIPGSCSYDISGLGGVFTRDKRNSRNYPIRGNFQQLTLMHYNKNIGSDFQFSKAIIDLRHYFSIDPTNTFAFQSLLEFTQDQAPFLELAELGDQMRAFDSARYIDNHLLLARFEYRTFPLKRKFLKRLGFAFFAETGNVTDSYTSFSSGDLKFCYGGGLRFSIFTEERTNLRFDLGFSGDKMGINIGFGEAF